MWKFTLHGSFSRIVDGLRITLMKSFLGVCFTGVCVPNSRSPSRLVLSMDETHRGKNTSKYKKPTNGRVTGIWKSVKRENLVRNFPYLLHRLRNSECYRKVIHENTISTQTMIIIITIINITIIVIKDIKKIVWKFQEVWWCFWWRAERFSVCRRGFKNLRKSCGKDL